jgi:iron complex transport system substrate-binding protein
VRTPNSTCGRREHEINDAMRIVSLLPSATEIAFELGLGEQLVGVSCDCDYPPAARRKPVISTSTLTIDSTTTPGHVDEQVRTYMNESEPLYRLDRALIRELQPDLILAQDLCRVCAVPSGHVTEALEQLGCHADVISLDPHGLDDVIDGIAEVATAGGVSDRGRRVTAELRRRVEAVRSVASGLPAIPALALEWADPPFCGGHWIPDMVHAAGGRDVLGVERAPSRTCTWSEIADAAPEVIVFMPCGYGLDEALEQARALPARSEFASTPAARLGRVWAVDGSAFFSRPGPRLVDGLEILAWILHPEAFPEPPHARVGRVN